MNNAQRNRAIHSVGLLACMIALAMTGQDVAHWSASTPSLIAFVLATVGAAGNVYGIWHPLTWFR